MNPHADLLIDRSRVRLFPRYYDVHDATEETLVNALASRNPVLCPACLALLDLADATPPAVREHRCWNCGHVTPEPVAVVFDADYEP